jgi:serine/threonine protein kinase
MPIKILANNQILQNRYRIASPLGQGGMGAVYRAHDTRLNVAVALKEMIPQSDLDPHTLAQRRQQFQQEATILAHLDHPHLVRVTDFFQEADNVYLVMNFIEGESLAARIGQSGALSEKEVLVWASQLLDALAYCHNQGVIHRDVKPQNVIIRHDGQAVLVDFGLVKLWDPSDPRTQTAMRGMGTPEYAPPEQYDVGGGHTDARSDIYSLGATLYHTLSGQTPPTATMRIVNPGAFTPVRTLVPDVSDRTEAAVTRAMELQPAARFQNAADMQAALGDGGPELTRSTPRHRNGASSKAMARHRNGASAEVMARHRNGASPEMRASKQQRTKVLPGTQPTPSPRKHVPAWAWALGAVVLIGGMLTLLTGGEKASTLSPRQSTATPTSIATALSPTATLVAASTARRPTNTPPSTASPSTPTSTPAVPQPAAAISPQNANRVTQLAYIKQEGRRIAWLPDADMLVALSTSKISLFDARTLEEARVIRRADAGIDATFRSLAVSPDGQSLATGSEEGVVFLWQASDGTLLDALKGHVEEKGVTGVTFSPDGATLASSSIDGTVRLWRVDDGTLLHTLEGHERWVMSVAFSPDGTTVASGGDSFDNTVRLWRVSDGSELRVMEERGHGSVASVAFSPDGATLASSWGDDTVRLWRVSDGALLHTLEQAADVLSVAFSPDGVIVASGTSDGTVSLWRVSDGELLIERKGRKEGDERVGHLSEVRGMSFSHDGKLLASGAETIALWGVGP